MKKIACLLIFSVLLLSCSSDESETPKKVQHTEEFTVGFSQMNHINPWRVAETNDLKREAAEREIKLIFTDAKSSQEKQIKDIEYLISSGADYIICAPLVYTGYEEAFRLCRDAGVPLIMLDREAEGSSPEDFLTFVGSDFFEEAVRVAEWMAEETGRSAKIIELQGRFGASVTTDRHQGFREVINEIDGMDIVHSDYADFERIKGQKIMEEIILSYGKDFDAVYAHNDEMAIGAIQALKAANMRPGQDIVVVSIDGSKDALKSIVAGELSATVECTPRLAEKVFDAIETHRNGKTVPPKIIVSDRLFDSSNALEYIDEAF